VHDILHDSRSWWDHLFSVMIAVVLVG